MQSSVGRGCQIYQSNDSRKEDKQGAQLYSNSRHTTWLLAGVCPVKYVATITQEPHGLVAVERGLDSPGVGMAVMEDIRVCPATTNRATHRSHVHSKAAATAVSVSRSVLCPRHPESKEQILWATHHSSRASHPFFPRKPMMTASPILCRGCGWTREVSGKDREPQS